jgi:hypothetical protein
MILILLKLWLFDVLSLFKTILYPSLLMANLKKNTQKNNNIMHSRKSIINIIKQYIHLNFIYLVILIYSSTPKISMFL